VSVFLFRAQFLETLAEQEIDELEVLTWDVEGWAEEGWHERAAVLAAAQGWTHRRARSKEHAIATSSGELLLPWHVYLARPDAIDVLAATARAHPMVSGALAASFDPATIRWRGVVLGTDPRSGYVQADTVACETGDVSLGPPPP
jgi:hypothetical protein